MLRLYWRNLKISHKLSVIFGVIIAFFSVLFALSTSYIVNTYNQFLYQKISDSLSMTTVLVSSELQKVSTLSYTMATDRSIQKILSEMAFSQDPLTVNAAKNDLMSTLYTYFGYSKDLYSLSMYSTGGELLFGVRNDNRYLSDETRDKIFEKADAAGGQEVCFTAEDTHGLIFCRTIRQSQNLDLSTLGYMVMRVNVENIVARSMAYSRSSISLILQGDEVYYQTNSGIGSGIGAIDSPYSILDTPQGKVFAVSEELPFYGWSCISVSDYDYVFRNIVKMQLLVFLGMVVCIVLVGICIKKLTVNVLEPLDALMKKMEGHASGRPYIPERGKDFSQQKDEFGLLHTTFDSMIGRIQQLNYENYEKKLLLKDAQLKALESQINPHFLFNTLNTITGEARLVGSKKICRISGALGKLLRAMLTHSADCICLEEEILLVKEYISIQTIRFEDRLNFQMQVEDELYAVAIPKMSIQPLIENAVNHALEELSDECLVTLRVFAAGEHMCVEVYNSGSRIDENIMEKLRDHTVTPRGNGVGLLNIDTRLKLIFGPEYGLRFTNKDNGVVAAFSVPLQPPEEEERST